MKLFPKGQSNGIKILSLAIGLAVGLVLIADIHFELSFDNFIDRGEDVYLIQTQYTSKTDGEKTFGQVPGAIAPAIKRYAPQVQAATRITGMFGKIRLKDEQKHWHNVESVFLADSSFFDVFTLSVLAGDPHKILESKGQVMISRSLAQRLGGDPVGHTLFFEGIEDYPLTVGGIYEDFPENSQLRFDFLLAMPTIADFSYDGRDNYVGNDRYRGYVRLYPGTDPATLTPLIDKMIRENLPVEEIKKAGGEIRFALTSYVKAHTEDETVRNTCLILGIVAFILLFTAVMNYVLIAVSTLVSRAKNIAVRKCYGAGNGRIYADVLRESALHLVLALIVTIALLLLFGDRIYEMTHATLTGLFTPECIVVLFVVCAVVLLACGLLPGWLYTRIPLHYAFRRYRESRRLWKLGLLFFQFLLSGLMVGLMTVIFMQYDYLVNKELGYEYDRVVYIKSSNIDTGSVQTLMQEVKKLPCVESASYNCFGLFCWEQSGDNVSLPGDDRELFNVADLFMQGADIFETMQIPIIQGKPVEERCEYFHENYAMVSDTFVERMKEVAGWDDNVIGRQVCISSYAGPLTISGVYRSFALSSLLTPDRRPSVMVCNSTPAGNLLFRLTKLNAENISAIQQCVQKLFPDSDLPVISYAAEMTDCYNEVKNTRDSILTGCLATLLITLIGLIGYIKDEVSRRSSEMAIRKINGATTLELQRLFMGDVARIALPALIVGGLLSYYVSLQLMERFEEKITLNGWIFAGSAAVVILVILCVVGLCTWRVSNGNPVENLKSE